MLVRDNQEPPCLRATFDGKPKKLAYFLNQVWSHMDQYGDAYLDEMACVNAINASMEGEAADWVVLLHDEAAPELGNVDAFMEELRN